MDIISAIVNGVYSFLTSIDWRGLARGAVNAFFFIDLLLVVGFVVMLVIGFRERPKFVMRPGKSVAADGPLAAHREEFRARWKRIMAKAFAAPPQSLTLAIIEADKCVNDALKSLGFEGEHMADRLEQLNPSDFDTLQNLWRAHRIRNDLVHTPDFGIEPADAETVLKIFEAFLKELEIL